MFIFQSRAFTLCLSQKYREVAKIFIQKIHLFYFKEKSDFAMKIHITVHKISFISAVYLSVLLFIAACMFNLIPMYNNYSAGRFASFDNLENTTYEQAISCLYPWNFETNFNGYLAATLSGW